MQTNTTRPTVPAPRCSHEAEAVAAYVRASERVAAALREQRDALAALRTFDSQHPAAVL